MPRGKVTEVVNTNTGELATTDSPDVASDPTAWVKAAKGLDDGFVPQSYEDLDSLFEDQGGLIDFEGSAYQVIDKKKLIDRAFVIVDVRIYHSDKFDNDVAAIMLLTKDEIDGRHHFVINDGSTGLFQQVTGMVQRTGRKAGFRCPNGLRASEYDVEVYDPFKEENETIHATTYYVA